jgi:hypothetical protein
LEYEVSTKRCGFPLPMDRTADKLRIGPSFGQDLAAPEQGTPIA